MAKKPAPFAGKTCMSSASPTSRRPTTACWPRWHANRRFTSTPSTRAAKPRTSFWPSRILSTDDPLGSGASRSRCAWPLGATGPGESAPARRLPRCHGGCAFPRHCAGEGATLLRRLQSDIVNRRVPEPVAHTRARRQPARAALPVAAPRAGGCRGGDLESVRRDPSLRLCDVAVIVPEASKDLYLAQLSAVFGESCDCPTAWPICRGQRPSRGRSHRASAPPSLLDLHAQGFPAARHPSLPDGQVPQGHARNLARA
jgi:hypothetical protein